MEKQFHTACARKFSATTSGNFRKLGLLLFLICVLFKFTNAQFSCAGLSTVNVAYTGAPQDFVVPAGVTQVRISLTGASGGLASTTALFAGGGATVYAYVNVVAGDNIRVIIGQKGTNGSREAGGGGASAVYKNGVLIMVAGGGGGEDNTGNGGNGLASENGGSGLEPAGAGDASCVSSPLNGIGGTGGNGGNHGEFAANCAHGGGGGGGLNSPGQGNGNAGAGQPGGQGNINGAAGGIGSNDDEGVGINGGWGWAGGGGADQQESGGGGGYAGGGGGPESGYPGGGGSFVAGVGTNGITESGKSDGTGTTTGYNGSAIICSSPAITLPVIFGGFTVEPAVSGALLKWVALSEINTAYFEVEKSSDGLLFTTIGKIVALGTTGGGQTYSFTDPNTSAVKTFYRVKAIDIDGKITYSGINTITGTEKSTVVIYPNPAKDKISILLPQSWQGKKNRLKLISGNGQVVMERNLTQSQTELNVSGLPVGVYLINVMQEKSNVQLSTRLVINSR